MVNVIEHPHMLARNLPYVKKATAKLAKKYDTWDTENGGILRSAPLEDPDLDLKGKVNGRRLTNDTFVRTWNKVIRE